MGLSRNGLPQNPMVYNIISPIHICNLQFHEQRHLLGILPGQFFIYIHLQMNKTSYEKHAAIPIIFLPIVGLSES